MKLGTFLLALFLILAGILLFLANYGYIPPEFGRQLSPYWPFILIVVGLVLFLGTKTISRTLAIILAVLLVVAVLCLVFSRQGCSPVFPTPTNLLRWDQIVEGAKAIHGSTRL